VLFLYAQKPSKLAPRRRHLNRYVWTHRAIDNSLVNSFLPILKGTAKRIRALGWVQNRKDKPIQINLLNHNWGTFCAYGSAFCAYESVFCAYGSAFCACESVFSDVVSGGRAICACGSVFFCAYRSAFCAYRSAFCRLRGPYFQLLIGKKSELPPQLSAPCFASLRP
jgi:hypothetical protein